MRRDEERMAIIADLKNKEDRDDYADAYLDSMIALQIKALRLQRGLTQAELAKKAGLGQSQVSEMEQISHSSWTIKTLRKLAKAFDLPLTVRFESFGWLVRDTLATSRKHLERHSFPDDAEIHRSDSLRETRNNILTFRLDLGASAICDSSVAVDPSSISSRSSESRVSPHSQTRHVVER